MLARLRVFVRDTHARLQRARFVYHLTAELAEAHLYTWPRARSLACFIMCEQEWASGHAGAFITWPAAHRTQSAARELARRYIERDKRIGSGVR